MIDDMLDALIPAVEQLPDWDGVLQRARRAHRRRVALSAVAAALIVVPAAYAVVRAFEGTPAPAQIRGSFSQSNRMADQMNRFAIKRGFHIHEPHAIVATAHGVLQVRTSDGLLDLWAARSTSGGVCWFIDYEADLKPGRTPLGGGACDQGPPPPSNISYSTEWTLAHPTIQSLTGRVYAPASSVRVELSNGSTIRLPVAEGFFLGSIPNHTRVRRLAAFNTRGRRVAAFSVPGARRGAP
jgi:hypothetical protein